MGENESTQPAEESHWKSSCGGKRSFGGYKKTTNLLCGLSIYGTQHMEGIPFGNLVPLPLSLSLSPHSLLTLLVG